MPRLPRSRRPLRLPGFAGRGSRSCFLMRRSQAREEPVRPEMGCGHVGNQGCSLWRGDVRGSVQEHLAGPGERAAPRGLCPER